MSQTYLETVSQAAERLEMAKAALSRDLAQAADVAGWGAFLRDKYDVESTTLAWCEVQFVPIITRG